MLVYTSVLSMCYYTYTKNTRKYEVVRDDSGFATVTREIPQDKFDRMCTGVHTDNLGNRRWFVGGVLHRLDGPAVISTDGDKQWHLYDLLHRDDGPAMIRADGTKRWYQHNQLHRTGGPAVVYPDGSALWFYKGMQILHPA